MIKALPRRFMAVGLVMVVHVGVLLAVLTAPSPRRSEAVLPVLEVSLLPPPPIPPPPKVEKPPEAPKPVVKQPSPPVRRPPPPVSAPTPSPVLSESGVTAAPPIAPAPPAPPAPPAAPLRVAAQVDAAITCVAPLYPAVSRRAGETGTVRLQFLVDVDGTVIDSRVEHSSGFARLDEAARDALSLCHFKPGTVDGRPERAWARLDYLWTLK